MLLCAGVCALLTFDVQYWNPKHLYRKDASFHVLITSYNLVTKDERYFKRLKWQYMVLDEAQAVKSSSSARWKTLLGFNCRNRLLLTGTPIQNNMAELWALLHFIMPKFFDSHQEFNEWFSRGIESATQDGNQKHRGLGAAITDRMYLRVAPIDCYSSILVRTTIYLVWLAHAWTHANAEQIQRLHMILKPFMMRRIKKDVENEIADKVEKTIYCQLTERQQRFYEGIKRTYTIHTTTHCAASSSLRLSPFCFASAAVRSIVLIDSQETSHCRSC